MTAAGRGTADKLAEKVKRGIVEDGQAFHGGPPDARLLEMPEEIARLKGAYRRDHQQTI